MQALPGRLDRSRRAIGAGRGREERQCRVLPLGLRPLEAERPVVREPRHETDRQSTGDVSGRAALGPRARPAPALRERRGRDPPPPRAALGQGHDFAYPMYPSRHFRPVREYHHIIFVIQHFGIKCRVLADGRSGCVYRTDRNGSIASGGPRSDPTGQGRTPPDAGQRPGRGRPGRLPAGKPSPRCMRRRRTGSRARCGRCSPMIGRTAATARVRRRSGRSDTKERRHAERLRKTRRRVMANRSDRDRPDPNPIAHEAQLGAAVFPGARASCPRAHSWTGHAPVDFTSLGSAAGSPTSPTRPIDR